MAEEQQFHLEIVTPDRQFFVGQAQELTVPAIDGSLGVLAGHGGHRPGAGLAALPRGRRVA
jgi:F0F1-type ATP synthase epsilon subunit